MRAPPWCGGPSDVATETFSLTWGGRGRGRGESGSSLTLFLLPSAGTVLSLSHALRWSAVPQRQEHLVPLKEGQSSAKGKAKLFQGASAPPAGGFANETRMIAPMGPACRSYKDERGWWEGEMTEPHTSKWTRRTLSQSFYFFEAGLEAVP